MKLIDILRIVGFIITIIATITYLTIVYVLIEGFNVSVRVDQLLVFMVLGAVYAILVSISLRFQGVSLAKDLPESKQQMAEYTKLLGKSKTVKLRPMWVMYLRTTITDIVIKGTLVTGTLYLSISYMIEGTKDQTYFLLAVSQVCMAVGIGLLTLHGGYNHYINKGVPYLEQKITILKEEKVSEQISRIESERAEAIRTSNGSRVHPDIAEPIRFDNGSGSGTASEPGQGSEVEDRLHQPGEVISGV